MTITTSARAGLSPARPPDRARNIRGVPIVATRRLLLSVRSPRSLLIPVLNRSCSRSCWRRRWRAPSPHLAGSGPT